MIMLSLRGRSATAVRLLGLLAIIWSVATSATAPGTHGRHLVVLVLLVACVVSWLYWTVRPGRVGSEPLSAELLVLAGGGGFLAWASPSSAASAFAFVAVVSAAVRGELRRAWPVMILAAIALSSAVLVYNGDAVAALAYSLGFAGAMLGASNARQVRLRADQAELLLAQTQRSNEEQLRAARLEESTRIARDIHDVLAHALAGLTIQLEATTALIENGAERDAILARVRRAHELARDGLRETRRAVGALRGDTASGGGSKPATLETGATVQVPLFVDTGQRVRVDTRTGKYVSRA